MDYGQEKTKEATILSPEQARIFIPQCCREGWPDCPHVPKKQRKVKNNVGM